MWISNQIEIISIKYFKLSYNSQNVCAFLEQSSCLYLWPQRSEVSSVCEAEGGAVESCTCKEHWPSLHPHDTLGQQQLRHWHLKHQLLQWLHGSLVFDEQQHTQHLLLSWARWSCWIWPGGSTPLGHISVSPQLMVIRWQVRGLWLLQAPSIWPS